jgi:hypothetical protein
MQIVMLDHIQKWFIHCINPHKQLNKYNAILLSRPTYGNLTPNTKSWEEDSQWNGKEMNEISQ